MSRAVRWLLGAVGVAGGLAMACAEQREEAPPPEPSPAFVDSTQAMQPTGPPEQLEIHTDGAVFLASCTGKVGFRGESTWPHGEAGKPPSPRTDAGAPGAGGHAKSCFQEAITRENASEVRVVLRIDVDDSGVAGARAVRGCGASEALRTCLVTRVQVRHFDPGRQSMTVPISFFREQEDGGPPPPNAIEIDPTALSACAGMPAPKVETSATFLVHGADVRVEGWKGDAGRLRCVAKALQRVGVELALEVKFVD